MKNLVPNIVTTVKFGETFSGVLWSAFEAHQRDLVTFIGAEHR